MNTFDERPEWAEDELKAEFATLFPHGWAGADVQAELAPAGWAASPLVTVFHPTAAQIYEETVRMHRNLSALPRKPDAPSPSPEPTLAEIEAEYEPSAVEVERECQELVGLCLWDVFSDNHEVTSDDGRWLRLGSARSSGGFLADILNAQGGPPPRPKPQLPPELESQLFPKSDDPKMQTIIAEMRKEMIGDGGYTYLDFYMGTVHVSGRADLRPVYTMIFRRLRTRGLDWTYHFPRLGLVDFGGMKKQEAEGEFAGYDPEAAMVQDEKERKRQEEISAMRESLDEAYREEVAAALEAEPPAIVQAYMAVYGEFPSGWPPNAD